MSDNAAFPLPPMDQDTYIKWRQPLPACDFQADRTALVVIDMQYLDAAWDAGVLVQMRNAGMADELDYYRRRLQLIVPNTQRLIAACRQQKHEVIFVRIASLTSDGRDRTPFMTNHAHHAAPGSRDEAILDELAPAPDEIVLSKTGSSVFNGTVLDQILRSMRVENLVLTGVTTTGCVSSAVRDASDLGYACTLVEDCCGAFVEELHWSEIRVLRGLYARVTTTDDLIPRL